MRIIDESGKWDISYDQVSLKLEKNRLYAYPLATSAVQKPIYLRTFINENDGIETLMAMRYSYLHGSKIFHLSVSRAEKELDYHKKLSDDTPHT